MRLCGFDTIYQNDLADQEIVRLAVSGQRTILTRDQQLLKIKTVTHGYWVRGTNPEKQLREVVKRMDLFNLFQPFSRCLECNGLIVAVSKTDIEGRLQEKTRRYFNDFYICQVCNKIYWQGSHYQHMIDKLKSLDEMIRQQE